MHPDCSPRMRAVFCADSRPHVQPAYEVMPRGGGNGVPLYLQNALK